MSVRETIIAGTPASRPRFELPPPKPSVALSAVALSIAAFVAVVVIVLKLVVPIISTQFAGQLLYGGDLPIALGGVSFLVIIPTFLAILMAHRALGPEREVPRGGRAIAGAALGIGYLSALFWLTRVILAVVWPQATGFEYGALLLSILYWT